VPLLPGEVNLYPADLFEKPLNSHEDSTRWWALYTRARAEKSLARRLVCRQFCFFLPLYLRKWRSRDRLRESHLPLFPGYIFLRDCGDARDDIVQTNLVNHFLWVEDQARFHADLSRVFLLTKTCDNLTPEGRIGPNTLVEITCGALAGMQGKVLRRGKQLRFFVEVQFLNRGVSVELESWQIRPIASLN
jgi:transcriptional antiterminator RfaH